MTGQRWHELSREVPSLWFTQRVCAIERQDCPPLRPSLLLHFSLRFTSERPSARANERPPTRRGLLPRPLVPSPHATWFTGNVTQQSSSSERPAPLSANLVFPGRVPSSYALPVHPRLVLAAVCCRPLAFEAVPDNSTTMRPTIVLDLPSWNGSFGNGSWLEPEFLYPDQKIEQRVFLEFSWTKQYYLVFVKSMSL